MNTIDHHLYSLDHLEGNGHETLQFIHKAPKEGDASGDMELKESGTTNEEVIRVVIDRIETMDKKFACLENSIAISHLSIALGALEDRTRGRKARGVEGKAKE